MSFQGINPNLASPPDARPPASLELADILAVLRNKAGLILRVTLVVVAAAVIIVSLLPTRYASSSVVMLDPRKNTVADLSAVLSALPTDPASLQNQIQILQSRDLAAEVIAKLKLYDDPEFNGALQHSVGSILLADLNPKIALGIGLIDIKDNEVESPDLVASRIENIVKVLGPERLHYVHPDCGFWMLQRSVVDRKMRALVEGRNLFEGRA